MALTCRTPSKETYLQAQTVFNLSPHFLPHFGPHSVQSGKIMTFTPYCRWRLHRLYNSCPFPIHAHFFSSPPIKYLLVAISKIPCEWRGIDMGNTRPSIRMGKTKCIWNFRPNRPAGPDPKKCQKLFFSGRRMPLFAVQFFFHMNLVCKNIRLRFF